MKRLGAGKPRFHWALAVLLVAMVVWIALLATALPELRGAPVQSAEPVQPHPAGAASVDAPRAPASTGPALPTQRSRVSPLAYSSLDPARFALTAKSFGGHPAYGQAMLLLTCDTYFKSRDNHTQDLADANQLQRSGVPGTEQLVSETIFRMRMQEVQCQGVQPQDIAQATALMQDAAAAGDVSAQSFLLRERANQVLSATWQRNREAGYQAQPPSEQDKALLPQAVELAAKGDRQAAMLAARLLVTNTLGQMDIASSASWLLVAMQGAQGPFDPGRLPFDTEPYSGLTAVQRARAVKQAQALFEACCAKPRS